MKGCCISSVACCTASISECQEIRKGVAYCLGRVSQPGRYQNQMVRGLRGGVGHVRDGIGLGPGVNPGVRVWLAGWGVGGGWNVMLDTVDLTNAKSYAI